MRRRHFTWMSCGVVLACLGLIQSGRAQSGVPAGGFMPLNIVGSPNALSADGTVIAGQFGAPDVHAFRWTEAGGQVDLGVLAGFDFSGATSISADGSVVVGYYREALALAHTLGMRPLIAHCHLGLANLSRHTAKRERAQEHLTTAMTMYRDMGMTSWLEKAEAEMTKPGG
jgi:probable HAF family extracellular repeat protein